MTRIGTTTPPPATPDPITKVHATAIDTRVRTAVYFGTRFSNTQWSNARRRSILTRALAALKTRRKRAARNLGGRRKFDVDGTDTLEDMTESRDTPDGDHDGREAYDTDRDSESLLPRHSGAAFSPVFRTRAAPPAIRRLPCGELEAFVSAQPPDADLSQTLPHRWCDALLKLRNHALEHPHEPIDQRIHEHFIDLIAVQHLTSMPGDTSSTAWRQRLIDAGAAPGRVVVGKPAAHELTRAGLLNLLLPLMLLMYGRPSTHRMREHALNTRMLQRNAATGTTSRL